MAQLQKKRYRDEQHEVQPRAKKRQQEQERAKSIDEFCHKYFLKNGINGDFSKNYVAMALEDRAQKARESFKNLRNNDEASSQYLSKEDKYNRRLENNRKSADAAKVHRQVLAQEQAHMLWQTVKQKDELEQELRREKQKTENLKSRINQLMTELELLRPHPRVRPINTTPVLLPALTPTSAKALDNALKSNSNENNLEAIDIPQVSRRSPAEYNDGFGSIKCTDYNTPESVIAPY